MYKTELFSQSAVANRSGAPESDTGSKNGYSRGKTCFARKFAGVVAMAAVITFSAISCGGGGGKSGLKKNKYLGNLPALVADNELAKKAYKENIDKLHETGNFDKVVKESAKMEKAEKERIKKFEADWKAELEKIETTDIPFTYSEAFKKSDLYREVSFLKLSAEKGSLHLITSVNAREDFTATSKDNDVYGQIRFRIVASDGSTPDYRYFQLYSLAWSDKRTFTKGQPINIGDRDCYLDISRNTKNWVNFSGVEFITLEEERKLIEEDRKIKD